MWNERHGRTAHIHMVKIIHRTSSTSRTSLYLGITNAKWLSIKFRWDCTITTWMNERTHNDDVGFFAERLMHCDTLPTHISIMHFQQCQNTWNFGAIYGILKRIFLITDFIVMSNFDRLLLLFILCFSYLRCINRNSRHCDATTTIVAFATN